MQDLKLNKNLENLYKVSSILVIILSIVGLLYAVNIFREGRLIGANASNTISLSGTGKVTAKPDTATITFSVREQTKQAKKTEYADEEDTKEVKESKDRITKKINVALTDLSKIVDKKDITTETYNSYPRYFYYTNGASGLIEGYDVSQTVSVKVIDIKNTSKILDIINKAGISEVSGPDYYIEKDEVFKDKAREDAISEAKRKANILAKQLGVSVLRIVSFTEDSSYAPVLYSVEKSDITGNAQAASTEPYLPEGENEITSSVTITFEIK